MSFVADAASLFTPVIRLAQAVTSHCERNDMLTRWE
jgi:hypothetical protein